MINKKVIQFTHPIHEHKITKSYDLKTKFSDIFIKKWNSKSHRRKYIRTKAKYITNVTEKDEYTINEGSVDFWAEWEPESVAQKLNYECCNQYKSQYPEYIQFPFYTDWRTYKNKSELQNTDPFVFDKRFYYTCCKQSKTKNVGIGSIILFGSTPLLQPKKDDNGKRITQYYGKFLVDTVFVVKNIIECNKEKIEEYNNDDTHMFYNCVLHKIHYGHESDGKNTVHKIYEGATIEDGTDMFSFFPCKESKDKGESRLEIDIDLSSNVSTIAQNTSYIIANGNEEDIKQFWDKLVKHTFNKGYYLGIQAQAPRYFDNVEEVRNNPYSIIKSI